MNSDKGVVLSETPGVVLSDALKDTPLEGTPLEVTPIKEESNPRGKDTGANQKPSFLFFEEEERKL